MSSNIERPVLLLQEQLMLRRTISVRNFLEKQMWLIEVMHCQGVSKLAKQSAIENLFYLLTNEYKPRHIGEEQYRQFIMLLPTWRREINYIETKEEFTRFGISLNLKLKMLFPEREKK